jgi:outer membrane murein-binding lipoprotein Lpp
VYGRATGYGSWLHVPSKLVSKRFSRCFVLDAVVVGIQYVCGCVRKQRMKLLARSSKSLVSIRSHALLETPSTKNTAVRAAAVGAAAGGEGAPPRPLHARALFAPTPNPAPSPVGAVGAVLGFGRRRPPERQSGAQTC